MKSLAARAYENDQYWLMDIIDLIKGDRYCEKQWEKEYQEPTKNKKFWRR